MIEQIKKYIWRPIFNSRNRYKRWYEKKYIIPPYSEKRQIILDYKEKYNSKTFVETGTYLGDTVEMMRTSFENVFSIELSEELAEKAKNRFKDFPTVRIIQGDSGDKLCEVSKEAPSPALYWLDGHYSHSNVIDGEVVQTAKGDLATPIMKELECILSNGLNSNVILIDDARCFVGKDDYPHYDSLVKHLETLGVNRSQVTNKRDLIRIVPA